MMSSKNLINKIDELLEVLSEEMSSKEKDHTTDVATDLLVLGAELKRVKEKITEDKYFNFINDICIYEYNKLCDESSAISVKCRDDKSFEHIIELVFDHAKDAKENGYELSNRTIIIMFRYIVSLVMRDYLMGEIDVLVYILLRSMLNVTL